MLSPSIQKNDKRANWLIIVFSIIVFVVIAGLGSTKPLEVDLGFNVHIFATANAVINSIVSVLLVVALVLVKQGKLEAHRNVMYAAMVLSILFLVSYILHHLFTGNGTKFGDINHDGLMSPEELLAVGSTRVFYYIVLITHILLAAIILPFILFTAYRAMSGDYGRHKKLARYTWPLWLYVSVTGVVVYLMISPYYS
jgi:putative membrane protein